ncbi:head GIN domain-containing protein [Allomuricauda sp. F6463D]|uniref:head GIN domain-containing protein n=1 Tax=Allomuricauda sp. F6463D TaxID=2926409 RepID=UPI001FF3F56B|nr:head GIN domain-containing protein [Muricauda sp. F6463D]MCK0162019.1 DUF2807 domain-containing protein [Muricauda sp. F6463D]
MKKIITLTLTLGMIACTSAQWGNRVKGNGDYVTIERSVGDYEGVALSGWFDLELVSGNEGEITLEGESNLLEHITTEVKNGKLVIKTEKGKNLRPSSWNKGIRIIVPVESIAFVSLSGSGDVVGKTMIRSDSFNASMSGSGDVTLLVEADDLEASLSGSGDINLSGRATDFTVRVSGSGDIKAYDLEADFVKATVSGSADIKVTANESIDARVSGSGDIHYRGNPKKISSKASGSGDITKG